MKSKKLVAVMFAVALVCGLLFLTACSPQSQASQENKKIAAQFAHDIMEGQSLEALASQYCAPDIQVEFPETFAMPHHGDHHIVGVKEFLHAAGAWQKETAHQVEVLEVVGEGSKVALLTRVNRVFKIDDQEKAYPGHLFTYFFEFKDGKIIKLTVVFDVLSDVEQLKAKKYENHKCRE